jgi:hypothetical protein
MSEPIERVTEKEKEKTQMPPWSGPAPMAAYGLPAELQRFFPLRVYNSLTRTKVSCSYRHEVTLLCCCYPWLFVMLRLKADVSLLM